MAVDLSVIVVNWNTRELLAQCLRSIFETVGGLASEVVVVDNASADGSAEMVRTTFPQVRLIENRENAGFARANNIGMAQSQAPYVLLLNSDTIVRPGALRSLLAFMEAHADVGACGARLLNGDGSLQSSCSPLPTPWRELWRLSFLDALVPWATYPMRRWDTKMPRDVEVLMGACLLLRQAALHQVGLLDEHYFMYTEEVDLCYRLLGAGWRVCWVPEAQVVHLGGQSARQAATAMYVQLYRSKVQFHRKIGGRRQALLFKGVLALAYIPRLLICLGGAVLRRDWKARATTYGRLLAELGDM